MANKINTTIPTLITLAAAKQRLDLSRYELFDDIDVQKVILLDGDTYIEGDLNQQWAENTLEALGEDTDLEGTLILVNGNLTVAGTIKPSDDYFPHLLVIGNVQCDVLQSYDEFIHITGNADITWALDGNYYHGNITIEGITRVPYVLNHEHHCSLKPEGAILINYYDDRDNFLVYDYTKSDLERIMMPAVFDENMNFRQFLFIELLKAGKSPLKEGVRPFRVMLLDELTQWSSGSANIQELDLSDKRLREFPHVLTKLTTLKKLVLNDNPIGIIPSDIKDLVNLEELHLGNCRLQSLPVEIGMLQNLRVLHVAKNSGLVLPESINQLSSLRVLNISYNIGFGLPQSLTGLKKLEELVCYQCSTEAPIEFPLALTQLSGLKRLNLGSNSIRTIPDSINNLQNLEELNLNAGLCYLDELPDLSKLKKLRTLRANGLNSFGSLPYLKQSLLRTFFQITSLEELYIDRHGERKERDALKAEHLEGISNLQHLKVLDLSFNHLTGLPEEMVALKNLQFLDLQYNRLSTSDRLKIAKDLPGCTIDFRDNRVETETADTEEVKQWQAMNTGLWKI